MTRPAGIVGRPRDEDTSAVDRRSTDPPRWCGRCDTWLAVAAAATTAGRRSRRRGAEQPAAARRATAHRGDAFIAIGLALEGPVSRHLGLPARHRAYGRDATLRSDAASTAVTCCGCCRSCRRGVPRLLYAHNLERDLFAAQLDDLPAPLSWARGRLRRDLDKLRACELDGMRACGRVLFISAADQAQARMEAGSLRDAAPAAAVRVRGPRARTTNATRGNTAPRVPCQLHMVAQPCRRALAAAAGVAARHPRPAPASLRRRQHEYRALRSTRHRARIR